jgi:hypothetical protein
MGHCASTPLVEAPTIQPPPQGHHLSKRLASSTTGAVGAGGDSPGALRPENTDSVKQNEPHTHVHSTSGGFIVPNEHTPHQTLHHAASSVGNSFSITSLSRSNTATSRSEPQGGVPGAHTELARLQGRHDVDVRSLPELPPALFLAAIFNDVAFFRAIPVVQSAVRLECRRKRLASSSSSSTSSSLNGQHQQQTVTVNGQGVTKVPDLVTVSKADPSKESLSEVTSTDPSSSSRDSKSEPSVTADVPEPEPAAVPVDKSHHEFRSGFLPALTTVQESSGGENRKSISISHPPINLRIATPSASPSPPFVTHNLGLSMDAITPVQEPSLASTPTSSGGPGLKEIMCAMDKHGETILHLAAAAGSKDVLELFLTLRPKQAAVKCGSKMNTLMHMTALGPAHVAEYYKAVRQHVLHNPDLLAESALDAAKIAVLTDGYAKADSGHDMIDYSADKQHHHADQHHLSSLGSFRDTFHRSSTDNLHGSFGSSVRNSILSADKRNNSHENLADVDKHAMKHPALTHGAGSYISIHNIVSKEGASSSVIPGLPSHPHPHPHSSHHAASMSLPLNSSMSNGVANASSHKIVLHSNSSSLSFGGSDDHLHNIQHQPGAPLILPRSASSSHSKGHHHYSDPLFITGFSYVKALMAYTERFEQDGDYEVEQDHTYEDKDCDGGAANTGPRNSPTNMMSPTKVLAHASHRLAGISESGAGLQSNRNSDNDLAEAGGANRSTNGDSAGSGPASSARSVDSAPAIHDELTSSKESSSQSHNHEPHKTLNRTLTSSGSGSDSMIGAFTCGDAKLGHGEDGVIAYLEPTRIFPCHDASSKALSSLHHPASQAGVAAETAFDINFIKASRRFPPRDLLRTVDVLAAHGAPLSVPNKYAITPVDAMQKHREMTSGTADADDSEAHLAGVERGAILRDPPWSLLLKDVAVDWSMVVDRLESKIQKAQAAAEGPPHTSTRIFH